MDRRGRLSADPLRLTESARAHRAIRRLDAESARLDGLRRDRERFLALTRQRLIGLLVVPDPDAILARAAGPDAAAGLGSGGPARLPRSGPALTPAGPVPHPLTADSSTGRSRSVRRHAAGTPGDGLPAVRSQPGNVSDARRWLLPPDAQAPTAAGATRAPAGPASSPSAGRYAAPVGARTPVRVKDDADRGPWPPMPQVAERTVKDILALVTAAPARRTDSAPTELPVPARARGPLGAPGPAAPAAPDPSGGATRPPREAELARGRRSPPELRARPADGGQLAALVRDWHLRGPVEADAPASDDEPALSDFHSGPMGQRGRGSMVSSDDPLTVADALGRVIAAELLRCGIEVTDP